MLNNTYFSIYQDFDDYKLEQRLLFICTMFKKPIYICNNSYKFSD